MPRSAFYYAGNLFAGITLGAIVMNPARPAFEILLPLGASVACVFAHRMIRRSPTG
jgi:hypothetical protein